MVLTSAVGLHPDHHPADGAHHALDGRVQGASRRSFARIHPKYLTPTWSTVGMGAGSIVFYVV